MDYPHILPSFFKPFISSVYSDATFLPSTSGSSTNPFKRQERSVQQLILRVRDCFIF